MPRRDSGQAAPAQPRPARRWSLGSLIGPREALLGAAAVGLLLGISWADEQYACAHIDDHPGELERRDEALHAFVAQRCATSSCEQLDIVSTQGCLAKIRTRAERVDDYGDVLGTFVSVEGLEYSPLLGVWHTRELLEDKQVLGMPVP